MKRSTRLEELLWAFWVVTVDNIRDNKMKGSVRGGDGEVRGGGEGRVSKQHGHN